MGPGNGGGEDEPVAVVEEGGVVDGVEGPHEGLVGGDGSEGGRGGIGEEGEGGRGIGYVVGFLLLEGALGRQYISGLGSALKSMMGLYFGSVALTAALLRGDVRRLEMLGRALDAVKAERIPLAVVSDRKT